MAIYSMTVYKFIPSIFIQRKANMTQLHAEFMPQFLYNRVSLKFIDVIESVNQLLFGLNEMCLSYRVAFLLPSPRPLYVFIVRYVEGGTTLTRIYNTVINTICKY